MTIGKTERKVRLTREEFHGAIEAFLATKGFNFEVTDWSPEWIVETHTIISFTVADKEPK